MTYDSPALKGELVSAQDEKLLQAIDKARQQGISAQVAARISKSVFFSKITERRIRAAQAVIIAEEGLMGSLIDHQKTRSRLLDLGVELEADAFERRNRRDVARRQAELSELSDQIAREEAEQHLAKLKRAREGIDDNSRAKKNEREYEDAKEQTAHNSRMALLEAQAGLEMRRSLREERDRMTAEVNKGVRGTPTPEQQAELDDINDLFDQLIKAV
jgi:hypothetical protein